jgi:ribonuclease HI
MDEWITLQFDGGSRGNPGPAGIGVVLRTADDTPIYTLGRFIGKATNNVAEYSALVTGLEKALEMGVQKILIRGDSELVIKQMKGQYRVKHPDMKRLFDEAQVLVKKFKQVKIEHNLRHKNEMADDLANLAMDRRKDVTDTKTGGDSARASGTATASRPAATAPPSTLSEPDIDSPTPIATKAGDCFACLRCGCVIRVEKPSGIRPHQLKPFVCQCGQQMQPVPEELLKEKRGLFE